MTSSAGRFGAVVVACGLLVGGCAHLEHELDAPLPLDQLQALAGVEEADLVIMALGFEPEDLPTLWGEPDLPVNRWGTVKVDYVTGATALDGVYAVGDIVRGASLVVWAIKDGRDCAEAILAKLDAGQAVAAE